MRARVKDVRKAVRAVVEGKVKASPAYLKKESVREKLQGIITDAVKSGEVKDQRDLHDLLGTMRMALDALMMVPVEVWSKTR